MTLNSSIASDIQKPSPGTLITLYKIDCTALDGPLYRFIQGTDSGQTITFNSFTYTTSGFPIPNKLSFFVSLITIDFLSALTTLPLT